MNYIRLEKESIAEAPGISVTLFVSGCKANKIGDQNCPGCHNQEAQCFKAGQLFTEDTLNEIIASLNKDYVKNFVLCGGEPVDQEPAFMRIILATIRSECPGKKIWLYTGYDWDKIKVHSWVRLVDVAVVGPFILAQRDISNANPWRGSRNQRVIDVQKSLKADKAVALDGILNNEISD